MNIIKNYFFSILLLSLPFFSVAQLCFNLNGVYGCSLWYRFAVSDLNKDGFKDIAFAGYNFHGGVMLGTGTGSFTSCSYLYTTGWSPNGITSGDFNNDTNPDLAVTTDSFVEIYLGNGSGAFGAATSPIAFTPLRIKSIDLNADLNVDLIVGNAVANSVSVFMGNGTGTFSAFSTFSLTSPLSDLQLSDFNNDGKTDIATSNPNTNAVSILLGTGTGSFGTCTSFTSAPGIRCITINDFNNDGNKDVAGVTFSGIFYTLLGNGAGSLNTPLTFTYSCSSGDIISEDFNYDGNIDIAVPNYGGDVKIFLGNGIGNFSGANSFTVSSGNPWAITADDFNGDSKIDFAIGCDNTGGSLVIYLNCNTLGVAEFNVPEDISVFPNPASNTLFVSTEQNDHKNSEIEIINYIGQTILKTKFKTELDISFLPNGIYILQLKNSQGQVAVKRLVVSK